MDHNELARRMGVTLTGSSSQCDKSRMHLKHGGKASKFRTGENPAGANGAGRPPAEILEKLKPRVEASTGGDMARDFKERAAIGGRGLKKMLGFNEGGKVQKAMKSPDKLEKAMIVAPKMRRIDASIGGDIENANRKVNDGVKNVSNKIKSGVEEGFNRAKSGSEDFLSKAKAGFEGFGKKAKNALHFQEGGQVDMSTRKGIKQAEKGSMGNLKGIKKG